MDTLKYMLEKQKEFQTKRDPRIKRDSNLIKMPGEERISLTNTTISIIYRTIYEHAEALLQEANEIKNWTAWKHWSRRLGNGWDRNPNNIQFSDEHINEIKKEIIDCLLFNLNLCILFNMDENEIITLFEDKLKINTERLNGDY